MTPVDQAAVAYELDHEADRLRDKASDFARHLTLRGGEVYRIDEGAFTAVAQAVTALTALASLYRGDAARMRSQR